MGADWLGDWQVKKMTVKLGSSLGHLKLSEKHAHQTCIDWYNIEISKLQNKSKFPNFHNSHSDWCLRTDMVDNAE